MIEYQQDDDGVISCKHRLSDDLHPISWCSQSKELCCYNANCRVPILTPLSEITRATEVLVGASENLARFLEVRGYSLNELDATRTALASTKTILKKLEE